MEIAAPAAVVWAALREKDQVMRWFGWDYPGLDEEVEFIFFGDHVGEDAAALTLDTGDGTFALRPAGDATAVTITRAAESDPGNVDSGWLTFLAQLRFMLERHPDAPRRTVRVESGATEPEGELFFRDRDHVGIVEPRTGALAVVAPDATAVISTYG